MIGGWDKKVLKKGTECLGTWRNVRCHTRVFDFLMVSMLTPTCHRFLLIKKSRWRINHDVWHVFVFRFSFFFVVKVLWYSNAESDNISVPFRFVPHSQAFSNFCRGLQSYSENRWHLKFICLLSFQIEFRVVFEIFIKPNGRHIFRKKLFRDTIFRFFLLEQM